MNTPIRPIDYQKEFVQHIANGGLVPVFSNGFRLEEIFQNDIELVRALEQVPEYYDEVRTIDQQLTKTWAKEVVKYPMSDDHNLARVAQYHQVMSELDDAEQAKNDYLRFMNDRLLHNYQDQKEYADAVRQFRKSVQTLNFSSVVHEMDLPQQVGKKDTLRLFAQLPLTTYITTSYFTFIERALKKEGKQPITQYWSWGGGDTGTRVEYLPDPENDPPVPLKQPRDCVPSVMQPVVYHLFGIENFPKTLVMSEDDYMNFLMHASEDIRNSDLIPSSLRDALSEKRLLLMGYNLRDWDFRALFRFISKFRERDRRTLTPSIAIQLKPTLKDVDVEQISLNYLNKFFSDYKFSVKWIEKKQFIYELFDAWKTITKGAQ